MHSNCYYELVFLLIDRIYIFSSAHGHACNLCARVCNVQEKRKGACFFANVCARLKICVCVCVMLVGTLSCKKKWKVYC